MASCALFAGKLHRVPERTLRERLADARTALMYGQNQRVRLEAMRTIDNILAELKARGATA